MITDIMSNNHPVYQPKKTKRQRNYEKNYT